MKTKEAKYILTFAAALAVVFAAWPLYAGDKDKNNGNVKVVQQAASKPAPASSCLQCSPVYSYSDDDAGLWDPFAEFMRMRQEMNNLLGSAFNQYQDAPRGSGIWSSSAVVAPACDIRDSDGKYIITMDLPGLKKSDIKIKLDGNILSVSGKREKDVEKKDGDKIILRERTSGSFSRVIRLAGKLKQDKVEAAYENGTLTITIPQEKPVDNSINIPIK